jgi:hypothetical protein
VLAVKFTSAQSSSRTAAEVAAMDAEAKGRAEGELEFPGVWVVPPVDGLPRCALCLFWRDPELGPRIGLMCGPAVELGEWEIEQSDPPGFVPAIVAAWRRLLARMGSENMLDTSPERMHSSGREAGRSTVRISFRRQGWPRAAAACLTTEQQTHGTSSDDGRSTLP